MNSRTMRILPDMNIILKNPIGSALEFYYGLFEAKYEELGLFEVRQLAETSVDRDLALNFMSPCDLKSHQPYCVRDKPREKYPSQYNLLG